jgi:hypothetical protein
MSMQLSPKKKYELTARCRKCPYQDSKTVEVEPENLANAETGFCGDAAKKHRKHPDLNQWDITHKELQ